MLNNSIGESWRSRCILNGLKLREPVNLWIVLLDLCLCLEEFFIYFSSVSENGGLPDLGESLASPYSSKCDAKRSMKRAVGASSSGQFKQAPFPEP
ncbi:MAG: hypothetical protein EZS28_031700 [Streblomastix strix]|uniref:Uncharacterized protein n=1 Tax=Streblomastix strix TaxID=222440 RepID=A0A5J4UR16_9EUKA|nr:MAG: hypothetical protein EZS28_031700 [Streblomastix strix]